PLVNLFIPKQRRIEAWLRSSSVRSGALVLVALILDLVLLVFHLGALGVRLGRRILVSGLHVLSVTLVLHGTHLAFTDLILPQNLRIIRKIFLLRGYHILRFYGIIPSNPY